MDMHTYMQFYNKKSPAHVGLVLLLQYGYWCNLYYFKDFVISSAMSDKRPGSSLLTLSKLCC